MPREEASKRKEGEQQKFYIPDSSCHRACYYILLLLEEMDFVQGNE
jgi:hypothetical protein